MPVSLALVVEVASAQISAGRDLLELPVGTVAEPAALAALARDGLGNPALILLEPGHLARLVAAALDGPSEQGVSAQLVSVSFPLGSRSAFAVTGVRAGVDGIPRTVSDPQSVGGDVPYSSLVASVALASHVAPRLDAGVALRHQKGELDDHVDASWTLDGGVLYHHAELRDLRVAASTYLLKPGSRGGGGDVRWSIAADVRAAGGDAVQLRTGYAFSRNSGLGTEHYLYASTRLDMLEVTAGLRHLTVHASSSVRARFGIALRSRSLHVGLAREENAAGTAPMYQVVMAANLRAPGRVANGR
jgi:hypothetical protein